MSGRNSKKSKRFCRGRRKKDGALCKAPPLIGEEYCLLHHPERKTLILDASKLTAGDKRKNKRNRLSFWRQLGDVSTMAQVRQLMSFLIQEVRLGTIRPEIVRSISSILPSLLKAIEVSDLDARLKFIEESLETVPLERRRELQELQSAASE